MCSCVTFYILQTCRWWMLVFISCTLLLAVSSISVVIKQTMLWLDVHYMQPMHAVNLLFQCTQNIQALVTQMIRVDFPMVCVFICLFVGVWGDREGDYFLIILDQTYDLVKYCSMWVQYEGNNILYSFHFYIPTVSQCNRSCACHYIPPQSFAASPQQGHFLLTTSYWTSLMIEDHQHTNPPLSYDCISELIEH